MGRQWFVLATFLSLLSNNTSTASSSSSSSYVVNKLPGFDALLPFHLETGYIKVEDVELFYYFVESQRSASTDPLLLWLIGGPGCSALTGLFFENGPLKFNYTHSWINPQLELNPYAWTQEMNIIYVDLPVGSGFSYSKTQEGYYSNDSTWANHAYAFLNKWFVDHPKFHTNPFYIGAGSYSALPCAPLIHKLYQDYQVGDKPLMNLKGYVMASPVIDNFVDMNNKVVYAHRMSLLSDELYESMKANCDGDYVNIDQRNTKCVSDYNIYKELVENIQEGSILEPVCVTASNKNQRNILLQAPHHTTLQPPQDKPWCREQNYWHVEHWANDRQVRNALHIKEGTKGEFRRCNKSLAFSYSIPSVATYHQSFTNTNLRALIYGGDHDMTVPFFSTQIWIEKLKLKIEKRWRAWFVQQQVAGYSQTYVKNEKYHLTVATVKGGGHVPQEYKPREAYYMIKRWFDFCPL